MIEVICCLAAQEIQVLYTLRCQALGKNKRKTTLMYDGLNPQLLYCSIISLFCQISVIGLKVWVSHWNLRKVII